MEKLAINGGVPVRKEKIYYGKQWIDEEDIAAVSDVLKSDFLTTGPKVSELESALCTYTKARYTVAVSNGTAALHLACIAAGIGPGDEVITTPLTFAASANCVLYCGGTPVFADVCEDTYNINPDDIERKITDRTRAIIAVDYTGQAVEHKRIREICSRHKLIFIEDAAHAIGTKYDTEPVGSLADMTCFSFHPVKTITSGEGGAVTCNDKRFFEKLNLVRTHGITHDKSLMEKPDEIEGPWEYQQVMLGYNYRLTDFQAALLISQLDKLDFFKSRRNDIATKYDKAFENIPGIILQSVIKQSDSCRHLYIIRIDNDKLSCSRKEFFDALVAENIICQVHYVPVYWFPYYKKLGYNKGICPVAEKIYSNIISIPLYPKMSDKDVEDVISAVKKISRCYMRGKHGNKKM